MEPKRPLPDEKQGAAYRAVAEVMWVERFGACETCFVGEENVLQKYFICQNLPQAPTCKLFAREVVGREQNLNFLKMVRK